MRRRYAPYIYIYAYENAATLFEIGGGMRQRYAPTNLWIPLIGLLGYALVKVCAGQGVRQLDFVQFFRGFFTHILSLGQLGTTLPPKHQLGMRQGMRR